MKSDFEKVANYADAFHAEHALSVLQENGIEGFLDNVAAQTALSYVGVATGGINLFVHQKDVEQAKGVLEELEVGIDHQQPPWFCRSCEVEVDGGFEVCWSCGEPKSDVGEPLPQAGIALSDEASGSGEPAEKGTVLGQDSNNPYATPRADVAPEESSSPEVPTRGWVFLGVLSLVVAMLVFAAMMVFWWYSAIGP